MSICRIVGDDLARLKLAATASHATEFLHSSNIGAGASARAAHALTLAQLGRARYATKILDDISDDSPFLNAGCSDKDGSCDKLTGVIDLNCALGVVTSRVPQASPDKCLTLFEEASSLPHYDISALGIPALKS